MSAGSPSPASQRRPARLPGRVLLTGVSSGIGAATARSLLEAGWEVVGISRKPPQVEHRSLCALSVDLSDAGALDHCLAEVGDVDAIVHAAGILRPGELGDMDLEAGRLMWRLHVEAAVQIMNTLAPKLPSGARVVLVGSRTATGAAGRSQYAATKAALLALARSWAKELVSDRICVNVVAPGATATPMLTAPGREGLPPSLPPMGQFIDPDEVATLISYLLSPQARSMTGQQLVLCAGASL